LQLPEGSQIILSFTFHSLNHLLQFFRLSSISELPVTTDIEAAAAVPERVRPPTLAGEEGQLCRSACANQVVQVAGDINYLGRLQRASPALSYSAGLGSSQFFSGVDVTPDEQ
jgi:hypothetical protein